MTEHETTIEADKNLPIIRIVRDFDASPDKVFRAYTDKDLFIKWVGPDSTSTRIDEWDARTGGHYRYVSIDEDGQEYGFYGSFHEARQNERLVQTFCYDGFPDTVTLETMTFTDLGNGRTRTTGVSVFDSMEARDGMLASGMETGVLDGYRKLDELLAEK